MQINFFSFRTFHKTERNIVQGIKKNLIQIGNETGILKNLENKERKRRK